ncbi:hypothetical protein MUK42_34024 [Musa troglodytarum]|uniref:Uncharacterized protein n=1 Tax=Musa troglodytarum TaxID=320322 RepID=A0A9E7K9N9_9LILI|nr:hypothetical protein MUK42_34024 [Musa troglodytarum]
MTMALLASLDHPCILCFKLNALQSDEHAWNSTSFLLGGQTVEQCAAGGRSLSTISNKDSLMPIIKDKKGRQPKKKHALISIIVHKDKTATKVGTVPDLQFVHALVRRNHPTKDHGAWIPRKHWRVAPSALPS